MNINEKLRDYFKMEENDVKRTLFWIKNGNNKWANPKEVIENAKDRGMGACIFAQSFDDEDYSYEELERDYEQFKANLDSIKEEIMG